ncbi:MAG: hypothetical protein ACR2JC_15590 [Chloroflexota bacterium]|nr:MAG: hypothetical protein DLM70_02260 [Chloroflexota bacterium]
MVNRAERILPTDQEIAVALGPRVEMRADRDQSAPKGVGDVLRDAAIDSAYRRYRGRVLLADEERPVAVGALALLFDSSQTALRTFSQVAEAAHLRTQMGDASVAVETVTSRAGLVSYWGFLQTGDVIMIVTLDTVDPKEVSITDLRSLLTAAAHRLEEHGKTRDGDPGPTP